MQKGGLYIHIPFCRKKCDYCDFYSVTALQHRDEFVAALLWEIQSHASQFSHLRFDTVYIGGGTPSLLSPNQFHQILQTLNSCFDIDQNGEFSIEANPGTVNSENLAALRKMGFNRLSLGVQSFHKEDLRFLGRIHNSDDVYRSFAAARRAGFSNLNFDLMTAFPGLTPERFSETLQKAVDLQPEHISCYTLIFEPGTPFYARMNRGELKPPDQDAEADFYEAANSYLGENGYQSYEISNFSKGKKNRCLHNLKYWNHAPYLGFGPSAHSFVPPKRWWNVRSLHGYLKRIRESLSVIQEEEFLNQETMEFEYVYLRLRLRDGIDLSDFQKQYGQNFLQKYKTAFQNLEAGGLIHQLGQRVLLTEKGWLLADEVAQSF